MNAILEPPDVPLIGSPYDLRVSLGEKVTETQMRAAVKSGQCGFVHSFTAGSAVDGPGVRLVAWLAGCQFQCVYCHNPDTWRMTNGIPITLARAVEQIRRYRYDLSVMQGGVTISGGEPLVQQRFVLNVFAAAWFQAPPSGRRIGPGLNFLPEGNRPRSPQNPGLHANQTAVQIAQNSCASFSPLSRRWTKVQSTITLQKCTVFLGNT